MYQSSNTRVQRSKSLPKASISKISLKCSKSFAFGTKISDFNDLNEEFNETLSDYTDFLDDNQRRFSAGGVNLNNNNIGLLICQESLKLSCPLLPIHYRSPLVVVDDASSDDSDAEDKRNRSATNFPLSSKSVLALGGAGINLIGNTAAVNIPKSPSHVFTKDDKITLRQLSTSAPPAMPTGSSKARQKKFHRHFAQVDQQERVLNYYSCALVGDILLQGHLYITKNYFAFYSNVFGYVTKLLIPIPSVVRITKEKTARIIPNAVGVTTTDEKHVFGSLLSRDATYKLMVMLVQNQQEGLAAEIEEGIVKGDEEDEEEGTEDVEDEGDDVDCEGEDDGEDEGGEEIEDGEDEPELDNNEDNQDSKEECENNEILLNTGETQQRKMEKFEKIGKLYKTSSNLKETSQTNKKGAKGKSTEKKPTKKKQAQYEIETSYKVFIGFSCTLIALLLLSAFMLLYRLNNIEKRTEGNLYSDILSWQNDLREKSAGAVQNVVEQNLEQIIKVRKSLETLSTLLVPKQNENKTPT